MTEEPLSTESTSFAFLYYKRVGEFQYAAFGTDGEQVLRTREECEERLANLKKRSRPHEQTERAIKNWPVSERN